ncbi:ABC1 kinase family protein [Dactylosporangium sp. CA-233914]|uniref:ABC1 kinase family protein n=1 Tax=Dactylosporangium sp. CA-233914 TaxID=3239934 RepID=UPI003D947777
MIVPPAGVREGVGGVMMALATPVVVVLFGALLRAVVRNALGAPVGWPRILVVAVAVFLGGSPLTTRVAESAGLGDADGTLAVSWAVATAFVLLAFGWAFALGVAALVASEALWPTGTVRNPVRWARDAVRARRRVRRYLRIMRILSSYGLARFIRGGRDNPGTHAHSAHALVGAINEAGVTFIKLGQMLSTRRDLLPLPYVTALSSLQSSAKPEPAGTVEHVLEAELGGALSEHFADFDPEPFAAASVAQVHHARLVDGTAVVVKVQRPAARDSVRVDSDILLRLARTVEVRADWARQMGLSHLAAGFAESLRQELDYRVEATNLRMVAASLAGNPAVVVPSVYEHVSTSRVMVLSRLDGRPLTDPDSGLQSLDAEARSALAQTLFRIVLDGVLVHGVFHADLHPGNVLLLRDGRIGLLDFGSVGVLDAETRQLLATLLYAVGIDDNVAATDALLMVMGSPTDTDVTTLRREIGQVITTLRYRTDAGADLFADLFDVIRRHALTLPPQVAAALRTIASVEESLVAVDPSFSLIAAAQHAAADITARMLAPQRIADLAKARGSVFAASLHRLPSRVERTTAALAEGTFAVRVRPVADPDDRRWIRGRLNDVVASVVAVGAILAAVLLIVADNGPFVTPQTRLNTLLGFGLALFGFVLGLRSVLKVFTQNDRHSRP